jgi:endonuclease YncB( thermonuclease family)
MSRQAFRCCPQFREVRRALLPLLAGAALLFAASALAGEGPPARDPEPHPFPSSDSPTARLWGTARQVLSGTHLAVMLPENVLLPIRLLGVEVPEPPRTSPSPSPGQPFGAEAVAYVRDLLLEKQIRLDLYGKDRGGRAMAVVWLGDINVNLVMVKEGLAWVDPALSNAYVRAAFAVAEKQAQVGKYGLWALPDPEPPWEFRKRLKLAAE